MSSLPSEAFQLEGRDTTDAGGGAPWMRVTEFEERPSLVVPYAQLSTMYVHVRLARWEYIRFQVILLSTDEVGWPIGGHEVARSRAIRRLYPRQARRQLNTELFSLVRVVLSYLILSCLVLSRSKQGLTFWASGSETDCSYIRRPEKSRDTFATKDV